MDIMLPEHKDLLKLLLKHQVNFMLIGGYAVIFHGYERLTTDLDIWLKPDNENRDKLINALKDFEIGQESLAQLSNTNFEEISFFHFGQRPLRIDFLTKVSGITYSEAEPEIKFFPYDEIQVPVIQYHHLILTKISNNRAQDKADIEMLQKINRFKI